MNNGIAMPLLYCVIQFFVLKARFFQTTDWALLKKSYIEILYIFIKIKL